MPVREKPRPTNCERDDKETLLSFAMTKPVEEPEILAHEETFRVTSVDFTVQEQATQGYLAGYFFCRLMKLHKSECPTCEFHGPRLLQTQSTLK